LLPQAQVFRDQERFRFQYSQNGPQQESKHQPLRLVAGQEPKVRKLSTAIDRPHYCAPQLANLGYRVSDQTVGNVLRRHGIAPAPERKRTATWAEFIRTHLALLAGTDFFTVEVLTLRGLVTYYVLFFIHLESRRVDIARITDHPDEQWMQQMARNATMEGCGALRHCRYLLHDRDTKYSAAFRAVIETGHVRTLSLPARSPNLNAYAERWVRSVKDECLSKVILFGDRSLRRAVSEYVAHYHTERNHQGKSNALLFPDATEMRSSRAVRCRERLGGLLRYYHQEAA
jgi:putative transposase